MLLQTSTQPIEEKPLPRLYSRTRAAEALNLCTKSLDGLIAAGELAATRIGRQVFVSHIELLSFLERKTTRKRVQ